MIRQWLAARPLYDVVAMVTLAAYAYAVWAMGQARAWDPATLGVIGGTVGLSVWGHLMANDRGGN